MVRRNSADHHGTRWCHRMMNMKMSYLLLACVFIAGGCALQEKPTVKQRSTPNVVKQATAPRDAETVLPLLRKFKPELGMEYITSVLGEPDVDVGSAVHAFVYPLTDGNAVVVHAYANRHHTPDSGEYKPGSVIGIKRGTEVIYSEKK